jgi:Heavy metal binding domain
MTYTCPMHREVRPEGPGKCPKCGMPLVPADSKRRATQWASNPLAMCLNPKVLAGLAVVVFIFQPRLLSLALPVLLLAACPLSMAAMMWGMRQSSGSGTPASSTLAPEARLAELRAELVRVKTERAQLSAELDAAQSGPVLPVNTQQGLDQKPERAAPPV